MGAECSTDAADAFNAAAARECWPAFCDRSREFSSPELTALLATWLQFAGPCGIPARSQLSPHVLKPVLRNVAIYERVQDSNRDRRYRVRLVGSVMAEVIGNLTGRFLDEAVPAPFLPRWYASLDATIDARTPLRFLTRSDTNHMEFLVGEYFSAPLVAADGSVSMVLGAGHFDGSRRWSTIERERRQNGSGPRPGAKPAV